ncbi:hypothetical protein F4827_002427 [Paraburkholderia bannensis]|uniref:Uncharacterized protein n=1 Tax=Paraburkholderia bannensis TaxID=765414 RepID=A0A7W9TYB8_9BURK|nr:MULTISPECIES: hypothetical protein [Paraburkholderia]MBB3257562.1 hypothetical protein [Paraburkholderia sp. WP4_3_2]MBB6102575.1 hypothetical protein [Paraburkholderia bannensis]
MSVLLVELNPASKVVLPNMINNSDMDDPVGKALGRLLAKLHAKGETLENAIGWPRFGGRDNLCIYNA